MHPRKILSPNCEKRDHISVCLCTYKRPELLLRLLQALSKQKTDGLLDYSVVIVDNDCTESAKAIVLNARKTCSITIDYYCEPEQNISLARNKTLEKSTGNLVVFIDDDQFPEEDWLLSLYKAYKDFKVDGVLGPIRPHFPLHPPKWIVKGKFFDRETFPTGTIMNRKDVKHMRTGNVLIRKSMIHKNESAFDRAFGKIGGEDTDFFRRKIADGYVFVWCDGAIVYETFPSERFKRGYLLRRALLRGVSQARGGHVGIYSFCKSLIAIALYTLALPVLLVTSHHRLMKLLIKDCDHIGKVIAVCGLDLVKERNF